MRARRPATPLRDELISNEALYLVVVSRWCASTAEPRTLAVMPGWLLYAVMCESRSSLWVCVGMVEVGMRDAEDVDLVVVDGPNLYNSVTAHLVALPGGPELAREYMLRWFDTDRLLRASLGADLEPLLGFVLFHSRKPLGRQTARINDSDEFWSRQGANSNTSTILVELPGEQNESFTFECKKCGHHDHPTTISEKGVDTTITTYLLETAPRWESVCIVSKDVDFVPPVLALRRHGKQVFCCAPKGSAPSALERVCQSFIALSMTFLRHDFETFRLLRCYATT